MSASATANYGETRTAMTWRLVVSGGAIPAGMMVAGAVLGVALDPTHSALAEHGFG